MPAGDLLSADWQIELRGLLMGHATPFVNDPAFWDGFGTPPPKTADVDVIGADGAWTTYDYAGPRVLTFALKINRPTATAALDSLETLSDAWRPSQSGDIELHGRMPGWGHWRIAGRPRGVKTELARVKVGLIDVFCVFYCPNPTITIV